MWWLQSKDEKNEKMKLRLKKIRVKIMNLNNKTLFALFTKFALFTLPLNIIILMQSVYDMGV